MILGSNATGPGSAGLLAALAGAEAEVIRRHGASGPYVPPHRIDHEANLRSLLERGCDRVLARLLGRLAEAGDRRRLARLPGRLHRPAARPDQLRRRPRPRRARLRRRLARADPGRLAGGRRRRSSVDGGVYWQTIGPRFETPAEIRLLAAHADLVGMTMASECIVSGELGLAYAAICMVDNLANGIGSGAAQRRGARGRPRRERRAPRRRPRGAAAGAGVSAAASLTVLDASLEGRRVGLRCEDGRIVALGPQVSGPEPGDELIDAAGAALVPPLVNGHTHAAMTLFRGYGGDLPLMRWLQEKIWPVEAKLEAEDVYWGTRLACVEMIRTGTSHFWDMYWHPEATSRAVRDAGPAGDGRRAALRARRGDRRDPGDGDREPRACRRSSSRSGSGRRSPRTRSTSPASRCCAGPRRSPPSAGCRSTSTSPRPSRR